MPITHSFVSEEEDSSDDTLVRPSDWNAEHVTDIDLTTEVSGVLAVANGGTGETTEDAALNALLAGRSAADKNVIKYDDVTGTWVNGFIADSEIVFTDIATNNASTSEHGYLPKLSGDETEYLNGNGAWTTPPVSTVLYTSQAFTSQTSINVAHNFGAYPVVQLIGSDGKVFISKDITHNSINDFTVTFTESTTGTIIACGG